MQAYLMGAALAATLVGVARAEPPPASAFGRLPGVQQAEISPDGQTVAMLGGTPEDRILSLSSIDKPRLRILKLGDVETLGIRWAGDAYVLTRVSTWRQLDVKHSYNFQRNIVVTTDAKPLLSLLEHDESSRFTLGQPVLAVTSGPDMRVIVPGYLLQQSNDFRLVLMRADPLTGHGTLLETADRGVYGWDVDLSGEARVRLSVEAVSYKFSVAARRKGEKQWTDIISKADEEVRDTYYGYSDPDDAIYLTRQTPDGAQMMRHRLSDGVEEPLGHAVKGTDAGLVMDPLRKTAVGIASGAEQEHVEWLDPTLGGVSAAISRVFKGSEVTLQSWSADRSRIVVRVSSGASPGVWYLFDAPKKELSPLGEEYPELKGVSFGPTRWITYKARDGLEIPAYLTLPPAGATGARKPPLIVLPHGGPTARDDGDFDWLTQFLATRGYAVLRPQFRGSTGFGHAFEVAGRGEWGGKMQTDLLDGVAAVASQGEVDTSRVCIVGWSFGGYAALAGVSLHPEAYKCAASMAGISNLGLLLNEEEGDGGTFSLHGLRSQISGASPEKLRATSPIRQLDAIRVPVLLMHGDRDSTVPYAQSRAMAEAMTAAGKPVEFVTFEGQDHYLLKSAPRTKLLETLGAFLAKNLPVTP